MAITATNIGNTRCSHLNRITLKDALNAAAARGADIGKRCCSYQAFSSGSVSISLCSCAMLPETAPSEGPLGWLPSSHPVPFTYGPSA